IDAGLVVDAGGVKLLRARWNGGIAWNHFGDCAAVSLDAERKRCYIEQQHVFHAAIENVGLDSRAERDDFVRVQLGMRHAAEVILDGAAYKWSSRCTTDEHDFIHFGGLELRVGQGLLDWPHRSVNDGSNPVFEP